MVQNIVDALKDNFPPEIVVFIISMLPLAELRGGLIAAAILQVAWPKAFLICFIGNMLPIPFVLLFIKPVFAWLRKTKLFSRLMAAIDRKIAKNSDKVNKYKLWGLLLLVAIPIPGTGAWTGALVADALDIRIKKSLPTIAGGVIIAGLIVSLISYSYLWIPAIFG